MPVVDTPGYLKVRAGDGSLPNVNVSVDGQGGLTPQHVIRLADGSQVGVVPMPTADATGNAALGTPADIAWASGSGTLVSLLKALIGAVSGSGGATGSATAARQDTGNAALGAPADVAWVSGAGTMVALLKGIFGKLSGSLTATLSGALPAGANVIGSVNQAPTALTNSAAGTMGVAAAIIVPASGTRKWLMITNRTAGNETQDIGSSNVTVGGGIPIAPGGGFLFNGAGAAGPIYGITTTAGSPFSYVEG